MKTHVSATFEIENWDEGAFDQLDDVSKVTRALVSKKYSGDIEGSSTTQWLMAYAEDGSAAFVGLERISGTVLGHDGTLVLQHVGTFADGAAKGSLEVLSGGTDALASTSGAGSFLADPSGSVSLDLVFD